MCMYLILTNLFFAVLEAFASSGTSTRERTVAMGSSLKLPCTPPTSYPKPDIFWAVIEDDETFIPVDLDGRVSMDPDGSLQIIDSIHSVFLDDMLTTNRETFLHDFM